jgi:hypothetical protein
VSIALIATDYSTSAASKRINSCCQQENSTLNEVVNSGRHLKKTKTVIDHSDDDCTNNSMRDATAATKEAHSANYSSCYTRENDGLSGRTIDALKATCMEKA